MLHIVIQFKTHVIFIKLSMLIRTNNNNNNGGKKKVHMCECVLMYSNALRSHTCAYKDYIDCSTYMIYISYPN